MPGPRLLPDNEVLVRLRHQGWTYDDIAREYGVGRSAVYLRLRNVDGAVAARPRHANLIPWKVATKHAHAFPVQMLRLLARRNQGQELPPEKQRMLDKWLKEVREADVVVCYDPEQPPNAASPATGGFFYSRRRESDGKSLIRFEEQPASAQ